MALVPPAEIDSLFTTFAHTAWRLESRDAYSVPAEAESIRQYLAGENDLKTHRDSDEGRWSATMRSAMGAGKRVERVRVVPSPLTDYLRWESWVCQLNVEDGEDIRYLDRDLARELDMPHVNHDYWLFDSHRLYLMHFDDADRSLGWELIEDPAMVVRANYYRDVAWHYAIPFRQWYKSHAHECEPRQRQASA